jgi:outer membrane lipoprotein SlyB
MEEAMTSKTKHIVAITIGALVLVALSAGASALIMRGGAAPENPAAATSTVAAGHAKTQHYAQREKIHWNGSRAAAQPAPATIEPAAGCDDGNVVGAIVGGAGGGVAGAQVGKGSGKTAATIAGTLGGAYLGKEFLPTQNVTCR